MSPVLSDGLLVANNIISSGKRTFNKSFQAFNEYCFVNDRRAHGTKSVEGIYCLVDGFQTFAKQNPSRKFHVQKFLQNKAYITQEKAQNYICQFLLNNPSILSSEITNKPISMVLTAGNRYH